MSTEFKMQHNFVMRARTSMAQKLPGDLESKVEFFRSKVHSIRSRTDIDYRLLGNMDETPVFFDMVPGQTVDVKPRKVVRGQVLHHSHCAQWVRFFIKLSSITRLYSPMISTLYKLQLGICESST